MIILLIHINKNKMKRSRRHDIEQIGDEFEKILIDTTDQIFLIMKRGKSYRGSTKVMIRAKELFKERLEKFGEQDALIKEALKIFNKEMKEIRRLVRSQKLKEAYYHDVSHYL